MTEGILFADKFYSERENLVRGHIGTQLDGLKEQLKQLYSPCITRLMNAAYQTQADRASTIGDLLDLEPSKRQMIVTATMYNDALWRLETAYLMLRIGILNVVYSNLRSCLETIIAAHIVENVESESVNFLNKKRINQADIAPFIPKTYNDDIKQIKGKFGDWGVHSGVESIIIGIFCNPNAFEKMTSENKGSKPQTIQQEFSNYGKTCIQAFNTVFLIFKFLINKGTELRRDVTVDG